MTRTRRVIALLVAIVLVGGVSACAPPVSNHPVSTPSPSGSTAPSQPTIPVVRVPLTCADLVSDATASMLTDSRATVGFDQNTIPNTIDTIAARQRGALECAWTDASTADFEEQPQGLVITIEPNAAAAFAEASNDGLIVVKPTPLGSTGDQASAPCETVGDGFSCSINLLVGGYWATEGLWSENGAAGLSQAVADTRNHQVLDGLVAVLTKAGKPSRKWMPPKSPASTFCTVTSPSHAALLLGVPAVTATPPTAAKDGIIPTLGSPYASCSWDDPSGPTDDLDRTYGLGVQILHGGAWALPGLATHLPRTPESGGLYSTVAIAGTTSSFMACDGNACYASVGVGSDFVWIYLNSSDSANATAKMTAIVAAVARD